MIEAKSFPTWKTIRLGTHKDVEALRRAIRTKRNRISGLGIDILKKIQISHKEESVDLVRLTVAELGFFNGATREQVYARAKEFGLELCSSEVGPQLRLQYRDQPFREWFLIGMEPIHESGGSFVFNVERGDDARWLRAYYGRADRFCRPEYSWVFSRRKY